MLFSAGGLFAAYEGIEKILHPHKIDDVAIALGVLAVAVVLESFSLRTAVHESRELKGEFSWVEFIRRAKIPDLPVVLLEDAAALTGLVLAFIGVGLAALTGDGVWDGIGTVAIGALLLAVAVVLIIETKSLLLGESASPEALAAIEANLVGPGVERIIHLRTMHLGPEELLVGAKLAMPAAATLTDVANAIDAAEAARTGRCPGRPGDLSRTRPRPPARTEPLAWPTSSRSTAPPGPMPGARRPPIPDLLGEPASGQPVAELWFGAHADDPSPAPEHATTLDALLAADPTALLGAAVVAEFGPRLPFLLKLLAAELPLVDPGPSRPRPGPGRVRGRGRTRHSPRRSEPQLPRRQPQAGVDLRAHAVRGAVRFPPGRGDAAADRLVRPARTRFPGRAAGRRGRTAHRVHRVARGSPDPAPLVDAVAPARRSSVSDVEFDVAIRAVRRCADAFPGDVGVVLSLLLNAITLAPGEAIYLGAGNVHAYLHGFGVEIMANSDNVLRCGLTPKHVDVDELLAITDFTALADPRWVPSTPSPCVRLDVPVPDFGLSVFELPGCDQAITGPAIVLALGEQTTVNTGADETVSLLPGHAVFVPAGVAVTVQGTGHAAIASPGRQT